MRGIIARILKFIASRFFIIAISLLLQVILMVLFCYYIAITSYGYIYLIVCWLLNIPTLIFIYNSRSSSSYKLAWLLVVACIPAGGILLYLLFANKRTLNAQNKKLVPYYRNINKSNLPNSVLEEIKEERKEFYPHANYLLKKGCFRPYKNTEVDYYETVDESWPIIIDELKKAKHFIFIESFIIQRGLFWNSILEVLKEKALNGVEVRIIYDDYGCLTKLPRNYHKELRSYGFKVLRFKPYTPYISVATNFRDHRKIIVIDGHTCFIGGFNFADEYVNEIVRFGHWKDAVVRLRGEATFSVTALFLSIWNIETKTEEDYFEFSYERYKKEIHIKKTDSYVQPFGDIPFDFDSIGKNVYLNLINRAEKYIYISTPYLILDEEISNALKKAALSGVDVKIVIPGIPDKSRVYSFTKATAYELTLAGVDFYFYSKGFNHQKSCLIDGNIAFVGSINFDLRSFYLAYEDGVVIYGGKVISKIENDFEKMFECSNLKGEELKKVVGFKRLVWGIIKVFSPLI